MKLVGSIRENRIEVKCCRKPEYSARKEGNRGRWRGRRRYAVDRVTQKEQIELRE